MAFAPMIFMPRIVPFSWTIGLSINFLGQSYIELTLGFQSEIEFWNRKIFEFPQSSLERMLLEQNHRQQCFATLKNHIL